MIAGVCRVCSCTDDAPCFRTPAGLVLTLDALEAMSEQQLEAAELDPCCWIEPDLCSACVATPAAGLILKSNGTPYGKGAP